VAKTDGRRDRTVQHRIGAVTRYRYRGSKIHNPWLLPDHA